MLMAPVNPSDLDMISGSYFVHPPMPAIGGNEGVGQVVDIGNAVRKLRPGDWVIPADSGMLKGFVKLSPGDYVIQNGANTSVGHAVIQLAKAWGINTISIIKHTQTTHHEHHHTQDCRDKAVVKTLVDLGATHVISDEFFLSEEMNYFAKAIPKPKLALDCEGSPTAKHMEEFLADNAVMVLGYWQSMWSAEHGQNPTMDEMVAELARLMREGQFQVPACDIYTLDMYHIAIKKAKEAQDPKRVLFKIDEELLL
nr:hypothetical protein BaRGS_030144 [Batillaria attramentaria]